MIEAVRHIMGRLDAMLRRGVVVGTDDSGDALRVQIKAWLLDRWMEVVMPYGLSFMPQMGAEAEFVSVSGRQGHQVTLTIGDRRYRLKGMKGGEVALHDDQGQKIYLTRDGVVIETSKYVEVRSNDVRLGNGADAALVRWPQLLSFLSGLSLPLTATANLSTGTVTGTAGPPLSVPSMGTTTVKAK